MMRIAKQDGSSFERCSEKATGELIDTERVTISSEGDRWKSTCKGNSLAAYPTSRPVLRRGGESNLASLSRPVCSSAKMYEIGENLLSVADPISRPQERLIHAGALPFASTLQRRPVPSVHPYAPVERSSAAMSSLPESPHWTVGHIPISTRVQALLVP